MDFYRSVYEAVMNIPKGKVLSYSQVAALAGNKGAARAAGNALHNNPMPSIIPCHRVVNASGRLAPAYAFGGEKIQRALLTSEGVVFKRSGLVDMKKSCWDGTTEF